MKYAEFPGTYNYKVVYLASGQRYVKENVYSIPLDRAQDEIRQYLLGIDEIGATLIEVKLLAVKI